jgi:lactoylglutathione lyase
MRYLHTMLRVRDLNAALNFFVNQLGLREVRRRENGAGRFTLVFLRAEADERPASSHSAEGERPGSEIELTHNWDEKEPYPIGRFFGHLAYEVDDIYATCGRLMAAGVAILRPPRDGEMAFIKSPDGHSIELLQRGTPLPPAEPWSTMPNQGAW